MIESIILSGLRVHVNISCEIYYSIDSGYENNKSHSGPVQYVLTLKIYQLEVSVGVYALKSNLLACYK